jgi:hypothetical protein
VPKATIILVLALGLAFGLLWGAMSLVVWSANDSIPAVLISPLWLTAEIAARWPIHPYAGYAAACTILGVLPAGILLVIARARGA